MGKHERRAFPKPAGLRFRSHRHQRGEPDRLTDERPIAAAAGPGDVSGVSASPVRLPSLQITRSDYLELGDLTVKYRATAPSAALRFLERELARAVVVEDRSIPSNAATLRSHVVFHDEETRRDWAVTLGHPADFISREDAISVLSPLGAALIGLSEGQSIEFRTADERSRRVALARVLYQPGRFGRDRVALLGP